MHRQVEVKRIRESDGNEGPAVSRITAILSYSKGFVCTTGPGTVTLFDKTEEDLYRKSREIRVNIRALNENISAVVGFVFI